MNSEELPIHAAQAGDATALESVLAAVAPQIRRFGVRLCGNSADADDVLQDTLLQVATQLPSFEGRSSLSSWVFTITRTACSRRRRGLKNKPGVPMDDVRGMVDEAPTPEGATAGAELRAHLTRAFDGLAEEHREVLLLRDMEDLSAAETAEVLGISVAAVKSRLHRARAALRDAVGAPPGSPAQAPSCPDVALLWSRQLEGDLSATDCAGMEAHVAHCPGCSAACDVLKDALGACRAFRDLDVPASVQDRVKAAVELWSRERAPGHGR